MTMIADNLLRVRSRIAQAALACGRTPDSIVLLAVSKKFDADAVRQAMKLLGVAEKQMESVSFGKEKPLANGHDEEAWAKNRRVDVNYQTR